MNVAYYPTGLKGHVTMTLDGHSTGITYPTRAVAERVAAVLQAASVLTAPTVPEGMRLESIMCAAASDRSLIETDNYGQLLVYTNLKEGDERDEHGWAKELVPMTDEDFEV